MHPDVRPRRRFRKRHGSRASGDGRAGAGRAQGALGPSPLFYNEEIEIKHVARNHKNS